MYDVGVYRKTVRGTGIATSRGHFGSHSSTLYITSLTASVHFIRLDISLSLCNMSATLAQSFPADDSRLAVLVPNKPKPLAISYQQLHSHISSFQAKLAKLGVAHGAAVSLSLVNSYEFIVSFLAVSWQRGIAAPLNPAYKQDEFEFYIDDLTSTLLLIPRDSYAQDGPAVRAGRKYQAAIAECYWDGNEVVLDVKESGKLAEKPGCQVENAQPDDIALVLHTSGTTGRPKAVCVFVGENDDDTEL